MTFQSHPSKLLNCDMNTHYLQSSAIPKSKMNLAQHFVVENPISFKYMSALLESFLLNAGFAS